MSAPAQRTPEERAQVLAKEVLATLVAQGDGRMAVELVPIIEPGLARAWREAERVALWDVILHLSLKLERRARPGGSAAVLAPPETPD